MSSTFKRLNHRGYLGSLPDDLPLEYSGIAHCSVNSKTKRFIES
ncbi:hypothetical protein [Crocosphaera sp.]|nr:hypothetical protein [Crocosphaera sp.]